jgi:hypothetical protein
MAAKKKPAPGPTTQPSKSGQGIAGIQAQPFADPINRAGIEVPNRPTGGTTEFDQAQADYVQINKLVEIAQQLKKSFFSPTFAATVNFNGRDWDKQAFDKELNRLQGLQTKATKRYEATSKVVFELEDKVAKAKDDLEQARFQPGNRKLETQLQNKVDAAEKQLAAAKSVPAGTKVTKETVKKEAAKPAAAAPRQITSAAQFRMAEQAAAAPAAAPTTTATTGAGAGGAGGTGKGKGKTKGNGKGKVTTPAAEPEWATIVKEEFGPLWDIYNSNADVKEVLDRSVKEGWFNDDTKLTESLRGTGWYQTTERSARQFAIRQSTDPASVEDEINVGVEDLRQSALANGLTLSDASLRRLATDNIKYGWSPQQVANAIGSEAIASARLGGAQGMRDLRSGMVGQNLRKIAASYAQKIDDVTLDGFIVDIMEGRKTEQQFTDTMRESAKTQFRSLVPQLDKGQTVDTALYAYKQAAQNTLGDSIDMSEIDWTSDKWNKSLNYRDEKTGEYRQMDLWEWNKYLRTLPEWQNTSEAKQTYSNVAYALAQGFGKIA